ncbi:MAG TPA: UbiA family prenyltransferase [Puia sp.]|nr:UbiA family prenyltransferase [Puia sp.]
MRNAVVSVLNVFLFSSLYISSCAVLMVYQTCYLLFRSTPSVALTLFVFFSTVCSYNFHWYLTPDSILNSLQSKWTGRHKQLHWILYLTGLGGSIVFFFVLREHWMALAFAGFVTFLYSAPKLPQTVFKELKHIAFGKTVFLAFVWMFVTTMLPIFVADKPLKTPYLLFACSRFFLIYAICIIFDYKDRADDKNEGIRSMITYFNERGINTLFYISLLLFAASSFGLYWFGYPLSSIIILLLPGIVVAALYNYAKKQFSDYLYYFVLDGMMMLSGLIMLIFRI